MAKIMSSAKHQQNSYHKNPLETVGSFGTSVVRDSLKAVGSVGAGVGTGLIDAFLGTDLTHKEHGDRSQSQIEQAPGTFKKKVEFKSLYNFQQEQENRTIKELTKQIQEEIKALKQASNKFTEQVKDIEKLTINSLPEKPGIYHVRFMEIVLSILRTLRAQISESSTWMEALMSKKKKRGSLFSSLSKKKGTQYSLSQELQLSRTGQ